MKKTFLAVTAGLLLATSQAFGLLVTPSTPYVGTGNSNDQDIINDEIAAIMGFDDAALYKQNFNGAEEGDLADSYETVFSNFEDLAPPQDPSDATISYTGGSFVGPTAFALVKDGRHQPAWYLFNLTDLGWHGTETLEFQDFWPENGSISHVALYGVKEGGGTPDDVPVPEPASMVLLGSGLLGLAALSRRKSKRG